jgi:hypothetical protein
MEEIAKLIVIVNLIIVKMEFVMEIYLIKLLVLYMMIVKARYAIKMNVELAFMDKRIFKLLT